MSDALLGRVGSYPAKLGDGIFNPFRLGATGELIVQAGQARWRELVRQGLVFQACNQAGAALTNLAAVTTGFVLYNPIGSGKVLSILQARFFQTSVAAAAANAGVQLAAYSNPGAAPTGLTALAITNAQIGAVLGSAAAVYSGATFAAAPVAIRALWQPSVSATATTSIPPVVVDDIDGGIELLPGNALGMSALSALSGVTSMLWAELPL